MKKLFSILGIILIIALAVRGGNHHRHDRVNKHNDHSVVISIKNDSAYVEVGDLLSPRELTYIIRK